MYALYCEELGVLLSFTALVRIMSLGELLFEEGLRRLQFLEPPIPFRSIEIWAFEVCVPCSALAAEE